jgi:hypothetical protein
MKVSTRKRGAIYLAMALSLLIGGVAAPGASATPDHVFLDLNPISRPNRVAARG